MNIKGAARRIRFGDFLLDEGRGALVAPGGAETVLRPKTFDLLRLLLDNPGRVVTRNEILDSVWAGLFVTDDSITQCVVELRKALGGSAELVKTLPRRGYILQADVTEETAPAAVATPLLSPRADDRPSIAVLPFRMGATEPQESYFADGIIEGIVHVLSGLDRLFVVSRGSALAFAQRTLDPRVAGRELGVRYVLQGGVRRAGGRLRVTTELSEAERGTILRTDRYDGEATELFEVQDRIAERVAAAILPQLQAEELARAMRKPPTNLTAYDLVLRALDRLHRLDQESFEQARGLLEEAAGHDPHYALAHTYRAWWHVLRIAQGWSPDALADSGAAGLAAEAAMARDSQDALATALRAHALGYGARDFATAERLLDRAVATSPSSALAWTFGAAQRCWLDRGAEAVAWAERGVRLAPQDPFAFYHEHILSQSHYVAGEFDQAAGWAHRACESNARHTPSWRVLVASQAARGHAAEARAAAAEMLAREPGFRLGTLEARTPLVPSIRARFVAHLRQAGLPD